VEFKTDRAMLVRSPHGAVAAAAGLRRRLSRVTRHVMASAPRFQIDRAIRPAMPRSSIF